MLALKKKRVPSTKPTHGPLLCQKCVICFSEMFVSIYKNLSLCPKCSKTKSNWISPWVHNFCTEANNEKGQRRPLSLLKGSLGHERDSTVRITPVSVHRQQLLVPGPFRQTTIKQCIAWALTLIVNKTWWDSYKSLFLVVQNFHPINFNKNRRDRHRESRIP